MDDKKRPQVLIIDRYIDPTEWVSDNLHWCDSSGSRSVWYWSETGAYEDATDLPVNVFASIQKNCKALKKKGYTYGICMRREDPGLGIWISEIDDGMLAKLKAVAE